MDVPAEPLLENAIAEPVHFGEVVDELAVAIGIDDLEHIRLLAGLVLRDRRRSPWVFASCAVAQGSKAGTYSLSIRLGSRQFRDRLTDSADAEFRLDVVQMKRHRAA